MATYDNHLSPYVLFQTGDFTVYVCLDPQQHTDTLAARSTFCEVSEDLRVSPEGDEFDGRPNSTVIVVCRDNRIVGTIRNVVYNAAYGWEDNMLSRYFPDALEKLGGPQTPFLESGRFAIAPDMDRRSAFQVQGILFRAQVIANQAEDIKYVTTMVRPNHLRFYEKYMSMKPLVEETSYKGTIISIMGVQALEECTFSYSLPSTLGIDAGKALDRYVSLKQQLLLRHGQTFQGRKERIVSHL